MARFSEKAERLLRKAGWYPGRSVDIHEMTDWLTGYTLTDPILEFLREFGGLEIRNERGRRAITTIFNNMDSWWPEVSPISEHLNLPLCPIANTLTSVMLMASDGTVYDTDAASGFDLIGMNGAEAIDNFLNVRYITRLPDIEELRKIVPPP